jgi:ABC-type dipeptide/oligopeptide/nickel transport system ATPase component
MKKIGRFGFFANRCSYKDDTCDTSHPILVDTGDTHLVRCPKVLEN